MLLVVPMPRGCGSRRAGRINMRLWRWWLAATVVVVSACAAGGVTQYACREGGGYPTAASFGVGSDTTSSTAYLWAHATGHAGTTGWMPTQMSSDCEDYLFGHYPSVCTQPPVPRFFSGSTINVSFTTALPGGSTSAFEQLALPGAPLLLACALHGVSLDRGWMHRRCAIPGCQPELLPRWESCIAGAHRSCHVGQCCMDAYWPAEPLVTFVELHNGCGAFIGWCLHERQ